MQAENFRKLLLTMSEDIRVVLIKMADRLHNMRTLGSMAPNKQYKIAGETLYIYAPLAHRLGLFEIKTELENLSFKYEHPEAFERISRQIAESEKHRTGIYNDFAAPIRERLDAMGLKYSAKARVKSVYSIWNKMETNTYPSRRYTTSTRPASYSSVTTRPRRKASAGRYTRPSPTYTGSTPTAPATGSQTRRPTATRPSI